MRASKTCTRCRLRQSFTMRNRRISSAHWDAPIHDNSNTISNKSITTTIPNSATASLSAAATSFYRRELPSHLVALTSPKGRELFKEALADNLAEPYFSLSGNFTHQSEPAYCGLAALAMVLNALGVDPGRTWKGPWRWYSESMLECCSPLDKVKETGLTFEEFACLAQCNGLKVKAYRGGDISYEQFIVDLENTARGGSVSDSSSQQLEQQHMVVAFSRESLGQTGDGHFSGIGAYAKGSSQALVIETALFKYPNYFVPSRMLYEAMSPIDTVTGRSRGYFILTRGDLCKDQKLRMKHVSATSLA